MRAHPASPLVRAWLFVAALVWFLVTDVLPDPGKLGRLRTLDLSALPWWAWFAPVLAFLVLVLPYWSWWTTTYHLDAEEFRVEDAGPWSESKRIAFSRIQGVELRQPFAARLLGLAALQIDLGADEKIVIEYLTRTKATDMRARLLDAARREQAAAAPIGGPDATRADLLDDTAADDVVLTRLSPLDLIVGALLSLQLWLILAFFLLPTGLGLLVSRLTGKDVTAVFTVGSLVPLILAVGGYLAKNVVHQWHHTVAVTAGGGVRVTRGLTSLTSRTVPTHRVLSVRLVQPLLWRRLGKWKVELAVLAGGGEDEILTTTLLPIGSATQVERAVAAIWPDLSATALLALPDEAWVHPPARARWLAPLSWRWIGWRVDRDHVFARRGALTRSHTVVPHERVISLQVRQGPLQRRQGLGDVTIHVAKLAGGATLEHMALADARTFLAAELAQTKAARAARAASSAEVGLDVGDEPAQEA